MNMKLNKLCSLLLAAGLMIAATACGGSNPPAGSTGESAADSQAAQAGDGGGSASAVEVKLVVWGGGNADDYANAAQEFNSRQDGIRFVVEQQGDYSTYLGAKTASNDLPDMFLLSPYSQVRQFAENGRLLSLDGMDFMANVYESSLQSAMYNGEAYAYPYIQQILGVFYNPVLFAQAGITDTPKTYGELEDICRRLQDEGITPFAAIYKDSWTLNHLFSDLLGPILGDDMERFIDETNAGTADFNVPGIDQAFRFMDLVMANSGRNFMDADSTAGYNAFASSDAAMIITGEFGLLSARDIDPEFDAGVFAVPVTDNPADAKLDVDTSACIAVNSDGAHIDETLEVLRYIADNEDEGGYLDIWFNLFGSAVPCIPFESEYLSQFQYYQDYNAYISAGNVIPWVYQQFPAGSNNEIGDIVQGYFTGLKDQDAVLEEITAAVRDLA